MNESPFSSSFLDLNQVFSRLTPQDVEQFQLLYQHWTLQQQIAAIERQIADVQRQLAENAEHIERVHPSAIALATLARLQASGVEDIDLLDRMLERGEAWLDRTIQQLEYCEQLDVIRGDYEEWCRHALEDAFAWIDSLQSAASVEAASAASPDTAEPAPVPSDASAETAEGTTEELFLQKLMSEEADESGQREAASAASQSNGDDEGEKSGNDEGEEKKEDGEDSEDGIYNIDADRSSEGSDENKDSAVSEEEKPASGHEEQGRPQIQEETAQRRSSFVQRFLSALWP